MRDAIIIASLVARIKENIFLLCGYVGAASAEEALEVFCQALEEVADSVDTNSESQQIDWLVKQLRELIVISNSRKLKDLGPD